MICSRHPWNRIQSRICLHRRSEQGAASFLKSLMLPQQPVSRDSIECETPCRVKMLVLVGFIVEEGLSFVVLKKKSR